MRYLIDTHVALWALKYPDRVGKHALATIEAGGCYISTVSLWEIMMKVRAGKLRVPLPVSEMLQLLRAVELPVRAAHIDALETICLPHKDPFDALLVAQGKYEKLTLISVDHVLLASTYDVISAKI